MTPNEEQIEMMLAKEEDVKSVALGEDVDDVEVVEARPSERPHVPWGEMSDEDKEAWRKDNDERVAHLVSSQDSTWAVLKELSDKINAGHNEAVKEVIEKNKADLKIPEGTQLYGTTKSVNYFCLVKDGAFYVGTKRFESLSAAAQGVSGVRRSGWTFWKMPDGRTVKEAYK
jgi:hypothetical protein